MGHPWGTWAPYLQKRKSPLVFGAQAGLYLPLLESEPTSYGGGPRNEHLRRCANIDSQTKRVRKE